MRLVLALLLAQISAERPPGFVRGTLVESAADTFAVSAGAGVVYRYRTDGKTWIERDRERIRAVSLEPGEMLEVVSDRDLEAVRYARTVHVLPPVVPKLRPISVGGQYRLSPAPALTTEVFTGLIIARERDHFTLRTRFDGDREIYLRGDTKCISNGAPVDPAALVTNARVSVTAVRGRTGQLDAERVIWGTILRP